MSTTLKARELRVVKGMAKRILKLFLLLGLFLSGTAAAGGNRAGAVHDEDREKETDTESPCEVKSVTVSTLPVLRENEFSFTGGGGSGNVAGGESRLLLFVRTDLPGRISVLDDLDNTALPYFTLGLWIQPSVLCSPTGAAVFSLLGSF
ncbi:hypothetical protein ACEWY4_004712 [Coilia grayii]|uniref:Astrotactin-2 n=1 Tax=Coilia grayii TaxID=363190 RepID=A0ABD1KMD2_9TELE